MAASLFDANEFFKFGFGEHGYAEFLRFAVLGAGVGTDDDVVGFLADRTAEFAAMLQHQLAGFFPAAVFERAGEDERFPGKFLAFDFAFFGGGANSRGVESLNQLAVGRFAEKLHNALADLGA